MWSEVLVNIANVAYTLQTMFLNNCKNNCSTFPGAEGAGIQPWQRPNMKKSNTSS